MPRPQTLLYAAACLAVIGWGVLSLACGNNPPPETAADPPPAAVPAGDQMAEVEPAVVSGNGGLRSKLQNGGEDKSFKMLLTDAELRAQSSEPVPTLGGSSTTASSDGGGLRGMLKKEASASSLEAACANLATAGFADSGCTNDLGALAKSCPTAGAPMVDCLASASGDEATVSCLEPCMVELQQPVTP